MPTKKEEVIRALNELKSALTDCQQGLRRNPERVERSLLWIMTGLEGIANTVRDELEVKPSRALPPAPYGSKCAICGEVEYHVIHQPGARNLPSGRTPHEFAAIVAKREPLLGPGDCDDSLKRCEGCGAPFTGNGPKCRPCT